MRVSFKQLTAALFAVLLLPAEPVHAGPPYVTDDPEPTDTGHWEIYNYAQGTVEGGATSAEAGFDFNYGGAKNLQLTATIPMTFGTDQPAALGDIELAAKYKVLHQKDGGFPLDVSLFPRVFVPTGRGSSRVQVLLPIWAEHDWGKWSLFGGGGYTLNPGPGNRNYWQQGAVLTRELQPGFSLGLEYYGQGRASFDDRSIQGINLGTQIHLKGPFSLLGSFGQGLNRKQTIFYTSLKLDL